MVVHYNVFRILGDVSHALSKCILIWAIHRNKSAEGVSLITQMLYLLVFSVRYLDLFWTPPSFSLWNFVLKIFYITSSTYIVFLMLRAYARTREREKAWRLGAMSLAGSVLAAPIVTLIFEGKGGWSLFEICYSFTLILEAFCILPQLLLLRQTTVPTVIDSYYLVALGSYRLWYILNWILRAATDQYLEPIFPISFTFGCIQVLFYCDFAWVYYSRQRVKLRGGGVVDREDFGRGWLVNKVIGHRSFGGDDDGDDEEHDRLAGQEEGQAAGRPQKWGSRGISVSADEGVFEGAGYADAADGRPARQDMTDPDQFADDVDDDAVADAPSGLQPGDRDPVSNSTTEWAK